MQDIEFTIEKSKLYMLQTRSGKRTASAAIRIAVEMVKDGLITENEAIMRGATGLNWKVSDSAVFTQDLSTEGGKNGWATESITALQHAINSHLASKISLKVDHNSKVIAPVKSTDIETAITLVVSF